MNARRLLGLAGVTAFAAFGAALVVTSPGPREKRFPGEPGSTPRPSTASGRTVGEEEAVSGIVAEGLRPATDADAEDSEARQELRDLYGDYRPYFVRGDFDGDGRLDFAQAFVRRDGPEPLFDVAVFFGSGEAGFGRPLWVDRGLPLSGGDLSVDRSVLVVTEDVEQDASRRFRWDAAAGRFVDVDAAGGEDGPDRWSEPGLPPGTTA